eukprot:UN33187
MYLRTHYSDPGIVIDNWSPINGDRLKTIFQYLEEEDYIDHLPSFKNNQWRPPRAHYSATMKKVVKRFDHYCQLANNGVGLKIINFSLCGYLFTEWVEPY